MPPDGVSEEELAAGWTPEHRWFHCQRCGQKSKLPSTITDDGAAKMLAKHPICRRQVSASPQQGPPGVVQQIVNYSKAMKRWLAEGRPVRPPAEIERIFQVCLSCDRYDHKGHRCLKCGCRINQSSEAWRNKVAMATEHCPIGKW